MNVLLPTPGTPVIPTRFALPGMWKQVQEDFLSLGFVQPGVAFHQRYRPRQNRPITCQHPCDIPIARQRSWPTGR